MELKVLNEAVNEISGFPNDNARREDEVFICGKQSTCYPTVISYGSETVEERIFVSKNCRNPCICIVCLVIKDDNSTFAYYDTR